jgi:hemolysin III
MTATPSARVIYPPEALPVTPRLRGRFHQAAFFVAVPATLFLILEAHTTTARVAAAIYALSVTGLYGVSAAYHRIHWSPRALRRMKRLDHSMIFVLIAGTTTPLSLLVLRRPWSIALMAGIWGAAAAGITLKMLRVDGFRIVTGTLYVTMGWGALLLGPQFVRGLSPVSIFLVILGGLLYTSGAVVLLRNKPDPAPATFGYHEIWHLMVIAASACHYAVVLLLILPARSVLG